MTINQIIDKLLDKYKDKDLKFYPDIIILKQRLVEMKVFWGGNTQVENEEELLEIIKTGINTNKS